MKKELEMTMQGEEKQLNSEKRKLEKFEKQKAKKMESVSVKASGEKVKKFFISISNQYFISRAKHQIVK